MQLSNHDDDSLVSYKNHGFPIKILLTLYKYVDLLAKTLITQNYFDVNYDKINK